MQGQATPPPVSIEEYTKQFLNKYLTGRYNTNSEAENLAAASRHMLALLQKLQQTGEKGDVAIPLRVVRDELIRQFRQSPRSLHGQTVDKLFLLLDKLDEDLSRITKPGQADPIYEQLRLRVYKMVTGETLDPFPELRQKALRHFHQYCLRERRNLAAIGMSAAGTLQYSSQKPSTTQQYLDMFGKRIHPKILPPTTLSWEASFEDLVKATGAKLVPLLRACLDQLDSVEKKNDEYSDLLAHHRLVPLGEESAAGVAAEPPAAPPQAAQGAGGGGWGYGGPGKGQQSGGSQGSTKFPGPGLLPVPMAQAPTFAPAAGSPGSPPEVQSKPPADVAPQYPPPGWNTNEAASRANLARPAPPLAPPPPAQPAQSLPFGGFGSFSASAGNEMAGSPEVAAVQVPSSTRIGQAPALQIPTGSAGGNGQNLQGGVTGSAVTSFGFDPAAPSAPPYQYQAGGQDPFRAPDFAGTPKNPPQVDPFYHVSPGNPFAEDTQASPQIWTPGTIGGQSAGFGSTTTPGEATPGGPQSDFGPSSMAPITPATTSAMFATPESAATPQWAGSGSSTAAPAAAAGGRRLYPDAPESEDPFNDEFSRAAPGYQTQAQPQNAPGGGAAVKGHGGAVEAPASAPSPYGANYGAGSRQGDVPPAQRASSPLSQTTAASTSPQPGTYTPMAVGRRPVGPLAAPPPKPKEEAPFGDLLKDLRLTD